MAITITKPTVGGSEGTWGDTINTGLTAIESTLNGSGTGKATVAPDISTLTLNGTNVTADAGELNKLDGVTATTAELNLLDGSVANTVVNSKAVVYGSAGEVQATTVDLGDWTITQSGSDLKFSYQGTARFKLSSAGALTVENNVTAYGSA
tara:strand:- start:682 stop:1134 length:453 start_codon:yes stop_codon:yes gene_type:complete